MASKKLSLLLPQLRAGPARLAFASLRSTPRTVISFMNFCRLLVTDVKMTTGVHLRIEPGCAVRLLLEFDPNGRRNCRYSCAFRRLTGSMVAGILMSQSNLPAS